MTFAPKILWVDDFFSASTSVSGSGATLAPTCFLIDFAILGLLGNWSTEALASSQYAGGAYGWWLFHPTWITILRCSWLALIEWRCLGALKSTSGGYDNRTYRMVENISTPKWGFRPREPDFTCFQHITLHVWSHQLQSVMAFFTRVLCVFDVCLPSRCRDVG